MSRGVVDIASAFMFLIIIYVGQVYNINLISKLQGKPSVEPLHFQSVSYAFYPSFAFQVACVFYLRRLHNTWLLRLFSRI